MISRRIICVDMHAASCSYHTTVHIEARSSSIVLGLISLALKTLQWKAVPHLHDIVRHLPGFKGQDLCTEKEEEVSKKVLELFKRNLIGGAGNQPAADRVSNTSHAPASPGNHPQSSSANPSGVPGKPSASTTSTSCNHSSNGGEPKAGAEPKAGSDEVPPADAKDLRPPRDGAPWVKNRQYFVAGAKESYSVCELDGGVFQCSCRLWKISTLAPKDRTCKHLRSARGDRAEAERIGPEKVKVAYELMKSCTGQKRSRPGGSNGHAAKKQNVMPQPVVNGV